MQFVYNFPFSQKKKRCTIIFYFFPNPDSFILFSFHAMKYLSKMCKMGTLRFDVTSINQFNDFHHLLIRSSHAVFHYVDGLAYCPYPSDESSVSKLSSLTHWNGLRFGFVLFQQVTFQQPVPFHFDIGGALTYVDSMNSFDATFCLQIRMTHLMTFVSITHQ
jgi:hypothetical protein